LWGLASTSFSALLSVATESGGVPAGAKVAFQDNASKLMTPVCLWQDYQAFAQRDLSEHEISRSATCSSTASPSDCDLAPSANRFWQLGALRLRDAGCCSDVQRRIPHVAELKANTSCARKLVTARRRIVGVFNASTSPPKE
jgi:hypothetical protein